MSTEDFEVHPRGTAAKLAALEQALERANTILAELSFSAWIPGNDCPSKDIKQRIKVAHEHAYAALTFDAAREKGGV